jgi:hypothetical protein
MQQQAPPEQSPRRHQTYRKWQTEQQQPVMTLNDQIQQHQHDFVQQPHKLHWACSTQTAELKPVRPLVNIQRRT